MILKQASIKVIEHWYKIYKAYFDWLERSDIDTDLTFKEYLFINKIKIGSGYCKYCKMFRYNNCNGCPVRVNTGKIFCESTPFDQIGYCSNLSITDTTKTPNLEDAVTSELAYLVSLVIKQELVTNNKLKEILKDDYQTIMNYEIREEYFE